MTFQQIVDAVSTTMNLTSTEALARVPIWVNMRYREVCSGVGLSMLDQGVVNATATVGSRFLTFGPGVEKLLSVYNAAYAPPMFLDEHTYDEVLNGPLTTDPASAWAVQGVTDKTVTVILNATAGSAVIYSASARQNKTIMSGTMVPVIPEDFHDILIFSAKEMELEKMEKYDMATRQAERFEKRLGELRYYLSSSAYRQLVQNKNASSSASVPPMV